MKLLLALSMTLAIASVARPARADAHSWGGESGRFQVWILRLGFDDGAGAGGWEESSAREFSS